MKSTSETPKRLHSRMVSTEAPNKRQSIVYKANLQENKNIVRPTKTSPAYAYHEFHLDPNHQDWHPICTIIDGHIVYKDKKKFSFIAKSVRYSGTPFHQMHGDVDICTIERHLAPFRINIKNSELIGSGTYGRVITAEKNDINGLPVKLAIKVVNTSRLSLDAIGSIQKEIDIWSRMDHENIVSLLHAVSGIQSTYFIMEYGQKGDLCSYVMRNQGMSERQAKDWFMQILEAINYMHENDYAHRDIKAENVIIFENNVLKVTDFSLATKVKNLEEWSFCGTLIYGAPEVTGLIQYCPYKADVWSLGILLFVMLTGTYPYLDTDSKQKITSDQVDLCFVDHIEENYSKECIEVLREFLQFIPVQRPCLLETPLMPWFDNNPTGMNS